MFTFLKHCILYLYKIYKINMDILVVYAKESSQIYEIKRFCDHCSVFLEPPKLLVQLILRFLFLEL